VYALVDGGSQPATKYEAQLQKKEIIIKNNKTWGAGKNLSILRYSMQKNPK